MNLINLILTIHKGMGNFMLHKMKLKQEPFDKIKNGTKTIELRLYDEKRQQVQIGDFIEFSLLSNPEEKITTRVVALHRFDSFQELYSILPKEKLGYKSDEKTDPNHMDAYYSREKQVQYGVLGIEIEIVSI